MTSVIVWDLETAPHLRGYAAANGHIGKTDDEIRAEMRDKFPKISITRLSVSALLLRTGKTVVRGSSMLWARRTLATARRRH